MNKLRQLREENLLTVRELAEKSGVSSDTITKIENGHRPGRSLTLRRLARALDVNPEELLSLRKMEGGGVGPKVLAGRPG